MTPVLKEHVDSYAREVESYEQSGWKADHDDAMTVFAVEDLIAIGLFLRSRIREGFAKWQEKVRGGEITFAKEVASEWLRADEMIHAALHEVLVATEALQAKGYAVANAARLREAHDATLLSGLVPARVRAAAGRHEAGSRGRPLQEVADELRRRAR